MYSEISIIIPCYKEAAVIRETLLSIDTFLRPRFERFEILVVTDGSPDETISVVKETQKEHPAIPT